MDLSHDEKEETWRLLHHYLKDKPWQRSGDENNHGTAITALTHELASTRAELARVECERNEAEACLEDWNKVYDMVISPESVARGKDVAKRRDAIIERRHKRSDTSAGVGTTSLSLEQRCYAATQYVISLSFSGSGLAQLPVDEIRRSVSQRFNVTEAEMADYIDRQTAALNRTDVKTEA